MTHAQKSKPQANSKEMADSMKEKRVDDIAIAAIQALDFFIAQASSASLGKMARILYSAKEELVLWAVDVEFKESARERFVDRLLYNNSLFAAADFIASLNSIKRKQFVKSVEEGRFEALPCALIEHLRHST